MIPYSPDRSNPAADAVDAFVATGTALLLAGLAGGVASAGASVYAAKKNAATAKEAGALDAAATDKQLAYMREKDAQDRAEFDRTQQFNLDQYNTREARLAPYRNLGTNATITLGSLIGGRTAVPMNFTPPPLQLPPRAPTATALNTLVRPQPMARRRFSDSL